MALKPIIPEPHGRLSSNLLIFTNWCRQCSNCTTKMSCILYIWILLFPFLFVSSTLSFTPCSCLSYVTSCPGGGDDPRPHQYFSGPDIAPGVDLLPERDLPRVHCRSLGEFVQGDWDWGSDLQQLFPGLFDRLIGWFLQSTLSGFKLVCGGRKPSYSCVSQTLRPRPTTRTREENHDWIMTHDQNQKPGGIKIRPDHWF